MGCQKSLRLAVAAGPRPPAEDRFLLVFVPGEILRNEHAAPQTRAQVASFRGYNSRSVGRPATPLHNGSYLALMDGLKRDRILCRDRLLAYHQVVVPETSSNVVYREGESSGPYCTGDDRSQHRFGVPSRPEPVEESPDN